MGFKFLHGNHIQGSDMSARKINLACYPRFQRSCIRTSTHAPTITLFQTRKSKLRMRRDEVITILFQPLEKLIGHLGTNRVLSSIILVGIATPVPKPAGQGFFRTQL